MIPVNHGQLIKPDIVASNGVINGIESVDMGLVHEILDEVPKDKTSVARR